MSGIGVLILPGVALIVTSVIFIYQLRLYLHSRRKNKKPIIPFFNAKKEVKASQFVQQVEKDLQQASTPQTVHPKKQLHLLYYGVVAVFISVVGLIIFSLQSNRFTYIPRASVPSTPTLFVEPSPSGAEPTSPPVTITYRLSPTISGNATLIPSPTSKTILTPTPTITPRSATSTPSTTKTTTPSAFSTPGGISLTPTNTPTPTLTTLAKANTTPTTYASGTSGTTITTPGKIPQSGVLLNPGVFLLVIGAFVLLLGFAL